MLTASNLKSFLTKLSCCLLLKLSFFTFDCESLADCWSCQRKLLQNVLLLFVLELLLYFRTRVEDDCVVCVRSPLKLKSNASLTSSFSRDVFSCSFTQMLVYLSLLAKGEWNLKIFSLHRRSYSQSAEDDYTLRGESSYCCYCYPTRPV